MKSVVGIAVIIVALTVAALFNLTFAQGDRQPYLPLARAEVVASGQDVGRLLSELREFAQTQKLTFREGNFPKDGRLVMNVGLYFGLGRDSFFIVDNFVQEDRFSVIAYSHDEEAVWRMRWDALLDRIRSRLGADRISIIIR